MATKQQKHQNLVDSLCSAPENAPAGKKWCADLSGYDWVKILNANPASQLVSLCHWDKLNGNDWTKLLSAHPDFAVHCSNWDLLSGNNWAELLVSQPSLAEHCRWDSLYDGNWAELLRHRPQFAEHCCRPFAPGGQQNELGSCCQNIGGLPVIERRVGRDNDIHGDAAVVILNRLGKVPGDVPGVFVIAAQVGDNCSG